MFIEIKNIYEPIGNGVCLEKVENKKLYIRSEDIRYLYGTEIKELSTMTKIELLNGDSFYTDMFIDDIMALVKED
jgi:hypothetical protein